jgi:MFS family permease
VLIALLLSLPHFNLMALIALFFGLGFFGSISGLTFAMGIERYPHSRALAVAWINLFGILPMLILNPLYGQFLDHLGFASLDANQMALWPIMILMGLSIFLSLKI